MADLEKVKKARLLIAEQLLVDLILKKARSFTDVETDDMVIWFIQAFNALVNRDRARGVIARNVLDSGLFAEHYESLLSEVGEQRTAQQEETLAALRLLFTDAKDKANERPIPEAGMIDPQDRRPDVGR